MATENKEKAKGEAIFPLTQEQINQIAAIGAKEGVRAYKEEQKKEERRRKKEDSKVRKTKKLLSSYRRIKATLSDDEQFTPEEQAELRWKFIEDLMGNTREIAGKSERTIKDTERKREEDLYCVFRIEKATCMYYTGVDPRTMEPVYVPKNPHEKAMQRALIQYRNPANYELVKEALLKAHRSDLIGFDAKCLIRPRPDKNRQNYQGTDKNRRGQDDRNMGGKNAGRKNTGNSSNQNGRNTAKERPTGKKKTIRNTHNRKKK